MGAKASASQTIARFVGQHNVLTVPRPLLEALDGDYPAAVLLGQIIYWSERKDDGWFHKSYPEWDEELCLTEYQVRKAAKKLQKLGIAETDLRKVNGAPTVHYKFDRDGFSGWILKKLQNRAESGEFSESIPKELQNPSPKDFGMKTEKTSDSYIETETTNIESTSSLSTDVLKSGDCPEDGDDSPPTQNQKPQDLKQFAVAELMERVSLAKARGAPIHDPIDRDRAQYARFFATRSKVHDVETLLLVFDYMVAKASGEIEGEPKAWCGFDTALDFVLVGWRPENPARDEEERGRILEENARAEAELLEGVLDGDGSPPEERLSPGEIRRMLADASAEVRSRTW